MKKLFIPVIVAFSCGLLVRADLLASQAAQTPPPAPQAPQIAPVPQTPPAAPVQDTKSERPDGSTADKEFVRKTAQSGMVEVELAELAQKKGQHTSVKELAQTLERDHGKVNQELQTLANQKQIQLETQPSNEQAALKTRLEGLDGASFDKEYANAMVMAHRNSITAFERTSKSASDAEIKAFASKTLPTLREHLKMAENAQRAVGGPSPTS
jgi:putative membrane protein